MTPTDVRFRNVNLQIPIDLHEKVRDICRRDQITLTNFFVDGLPILIAEAQNRKVFKVDMSNLSPYHQKQIDELVASGVLR